MHHSFPGRGVSHPDDSCINGSIMEDSSSLVIGVWQRGVGLIGMRWIPDMAFFWVHSFSQLQNHSYPDKCWFIFHPHQCIQHCSTGYEASIFVHFVLKLFVILMLSVHLLIRVPNQQNDYLAHGVSPTRVFNIPCLLIVLGDYC